MGIIGPEQFFDIKVQQVTDDYFFLQAGTEADKMYSCLQFC